MRIHIKGEGTELLSSEEDNLTVEPRTILTTAFCFQSPVEFKFKSFVADCAEI